VAGSWGAGPGTSLATGAGGEGRFLQFATTNITDIAKTIAANTARGDKALAVPGFT
jgi:hypothetical protein